MVFFAPTNRNSKQEERVHLFGIIPPTWTGRLEASLLLAAVAYHDGKPAAATAGRFSRQIP